MRGTSRRSGGDGPRSFDGSEGNETVLRQEDQWLYDLQIEEGDTVVVLEGRLYKRKLK